VKVGAAALKYLLIRDFVFADYSNALDLFFYKNNASRFDCCLTKKYQYQGYLEWLLSFGGAHCEGFSLVFLYELV
jgi:hypothetical protein